LRCLKQLSKVPQAQKHPDSSVGVGVGKLLSVTWPLIVITALMLSLCVASLSVLSSLRAYVQGEGMWSKSERQAIAELRAFSTTGDEAAFRRFQVEIGVPLADRVARLELERAAPDYAVARRAIEAGRTDPADSVGMIRLFRVFHDSRLFSDALDAWTQGDELIVQLADIGRQIHAGLSDGRADPAVAMRLQQAELIHLRVAPLEDRFSSSLGTASRQVLKLLLVFLTLCSAVLVAIGAVISRHTIRRGERIARALHETEERAYAEQARAHVTLESIADAVICTDREQRVSYLNGAAEQLTLWSESEAQGQLLSTVLQMRSEPGTHDVPNDISRILSGQQRAGPITGVLLQRRDGSVIPIQERVAPIRDASGAVTGVVLVLRDITQERAAAAQLRHQATHDALTGLVNRREFEHRLQLAIENRASSGAQHALLYLDLDQFKVINDTCGHAAGDELIRQVAWSIRQLIRAEDLLARLGGDEFGILLANTSPDDAIQMAESVRRRIADVRFTWEEKFFVVNVSIGVLSLADCLPAVAEAMSAADQACYLAKDNGRNRVQPYRPDDQEMRARHGEMQWVERLNAALEHDRFVLFGQEIRPIGESSPVADAAIQGAPCTSRVEVLLRLIDTDGTLVAPMAFIPAAERYGLMPRIDRWVIAHACNRLALTYARVGRAPTCMINLSGASVTDPGLADFVRARLAQCALPPNSIAFELTETAAIANLERAAQMMNELRKLGCAIALDDFGSGMSSFAYLRTLPIDFLKIDGEFVKDMATDAIDLAVVESIQKIARVMGIKTVAESVENAAILTSATLVGVDFAQGYHLGRPMPLPELLELLEQRQSNADKVLAEQDHDTGRERQQHTGLKSAVTP
jgi:diguanylate cyclase (GGDEF)-like protein/PAS domain S-box-containing protein